jgi:hypothetical protein
MGSQAMPARLQHDFLSESGEAAFVSPSAMFSDSVGLVEPAILQSNHSPAVKQKMAEVAEMLAHDPIAMRLFSDRIYQLLLDDIKAQQERTYGYGKRH